MSEMVESGITSVEFWGYYSTACYEKFECRFKVIGRSTLTSGISFSVNKKKNL